MTATASCAGIDAEPASQQIGHLGDHELRHHERTWVGFQKFETFGVVRVVCIHVGVQRARVDDQRDPGTSAVRISSIRSEISDRPLPPACCGEQASTTTRPAEMRFDRLSREIGHGHPTALCLVSQAGIKIVRQLDGRALHGMSACPCRR